MLHKKNGSVKGTLILLLVVMSVLFIKIGFISKENWYYGLVVTLPLLLITVIDVPYSTKRLANKLQSAA